MRILSLGASGLRGDILTGFVDSSIARYAVIEARRTEGSSERFVIAYRDEDSLRELIAGPSIIACGFANREDAQANIEADFRPAEARRQISGGPVDQAAKCQRRVVSAKQRLGRGFNLTQSRNIVGGFLQAAVAWAILIFYSRNAVSTAIRSFVVG
jgi:hypothetical protein